MVQLQYDWGKRCQYVVYYYVYYRPIRLYEPREEKHENSLSSAKAAKDHLLMLGRVENLERKVEEVI